MSKYPFHRSATEEDYRKLQNYSIGTFHRISALTGKVELVPLDASDRMQEALDAVEISLKEAREEIAIHMAEHPNLSQQVETYPQEAFRRLSKLKGNKEGES